MFAKGSHYALEELSKLEYDIIGIDWTINPQAARYVLLVLFGSYDNYFTAKLQQVEILHYKAILTLVHYMLQR